MYANNENEKVTSHTVLKAETRTKTLFKGEILTCQQDR